MNKVVNSRYMPSVFDNNAIDIPEDIQDISKIGYFKKKKAKKAILWLLSTALHSAEEIADHFELSPELVKGLLMELTKDNLVVKVPGYPYKYCLKSKIDGKKKGTIRNSRGGDKVDNHDACNTKIYQ